MLRQDLRISYRSEIERPLKSIFTGRELEPVHVELDRIHSNARSSRLFVATHMHAGDGNVHTNIPVNSNDYAMMHAADRIVSRVMELAARLDGVISGEHGIGITKLPVPVAGNRHGIFGLQAEESTRTGTSTAASCCRAQI